MPFCPNCGTHNADDSAFCVDCGHALAAGGAGGVATATGEPRYGGFWRRFVALLIDTVILWIPLGIFVGVTHLYTIQHLSNGGHTVRSYQLSAGGELIGLVAGWLYFALQESSSRQATVGKRALNMKVTDNAGHRISFGRASGRYFAKIISGITLLIGYIIAAFTPRKRALHDMIASTLVRRI